MRRTAFTALLLLGASLAGCAAGDRARSRWEVVRDELGRERRIEGHSLLGRLLYSPPPGAEVGALRAGLSAAWEALEAEPQDPHKWVAVGRRLAALWRMPDAIELYSAALERFPDSALLHRRRGHRMISMRRFPDAVADLRRAADLYTAQSPGAPPRGASPDAGEQYRQLGFDIYYHLGLAHYLRGDFSEAADAYAAAREYANTDDLLVAVLDWQWLALQRVGRPDAAQRLLEAVRADMSINENHAYHRRLLLYKGLLAPDDVLAPVEAPLQFATAAYGVARWYALHGRTERANELFREIVHGPAWPAFGFIAAEADLLRQHPELAARAVNEKRRPPGSERSP